MGPIERLELNKNNLTKSEIEIMEYIKKNPMDIVQFSIIQIAEKANTSKSAVIRLCQKIGYDGFSEFKFDMSRYLVSNNVSVLSFTTSCRWRMRWSVRTSTSCSHAPVGML